MRGTAPLQIGINFFLSLGPGLHVAKKPFANIYDLVELTELQNIAGETRQICYFGPLSTNDKLSADPTDRAKMHSANKQFFEIAFLVLHDELRHQQMTKMTHLLTPYMLT